MPYKYEKIRDEVKAMVKEAAYAPSNRYTFTVWNHHIVPVVDHGLDLSRRLKGDREVVELSAYLHDLACLKDVGNYKQHHIHSAKMAGDILMQYDYPPQKIYHIQNCIYTHRGSVVIPPQSLEARILASADAMSHITELADIFYLTFGVKKYTTRDGAIWLKRKLERSWAKIIPAGRELVKLEYRIAMKILNNAIDKKD